jgi:hypothetical protein
MSRIDINETFIKHYSVGLQDIGDSRSEHMQIQTTGEYIDTAHYPILYALRKLNYVQYFTKEELSYLEQVVIVKIRTRQLQERIDNL